MSGAARRLLRATLPILVWLATPCVAQTPAPTATGPSSTPPGVPAPVPYSPSFSDLMNIGVQPRHIKLWMAGRLRNWTYAAYEVDELRNAFARIGRTVPVYRGLDVPAVTAAFMQQPLDALGSAIKNQDGAAYIAAYKLLTERCNACHQGSEHAMVVVRVPNGSAYVDQDFRATPNNGAH